MDGLIDAVDLQVAKSADSATVNLGVLVPDVYELLWGEVPASFVIVPRCTVRSRLGVLKDGNDRWWSLDADGARDMVSTIADDCVSEFFERMRDRRAVEEFLFSQIAGIRRPYPPNLICHAILKSEHVDRSVVCKELRAHRESVGAWSDRVDALLRHLRCPSE